MSKRKYQLMGAIIQERDEKKIIDWDFVSQQFSANDYKTANGLSTMA